MHCYNRHLGDFISSTLVLTMVEEGAYSRLLDQYYICEHALPADRNMLYRLARARSASERRAVDRVIDRFFSLSEEGYTHGGVERDIADRRDKQAKAARSAEARRKRHQTAEPACKTDANAYANDHANAMQNGCETVCKTACKSDAHQTPDTKLQTPVNPTPKLSPETRHADSPHEAHRVGGVAFENEKFNPSAGTAQHLAGMLGQRPGGSGTWPGHSQ